MLVIVSVSEPHSCLLMSVSLSQNFNCSYHLHNYELTKRGYRSLKGSSRPGMRYQPPTIFLLIQHKSLRLIRIVWFQNQVVIT